MKFAHSSIESGKRFAAGKFTPRIRRCAMNLVKRKNADSPLGHLQDPMSNVLSRFFDDWQMGDFGAKNWLPLDIAESEDEFTVQAELPGLNSEDVDISVVNNMLTISGEKKVEKEDKGKNYYHTERRYGSFHRSLQLTSNVDQNKVEASYKNGILTITLPKSENAKARKIPVKS